MRCKYKDPTRALTNPNDVHHSGELIEHKSYYLSIHVLP